MDSTVSDADAAKAVTAFNGAKRIATAKATDASGTQQIEVRKDKDNNYYARSSAVEGTHKVGNDLGDGLDKSLDDFRNKKLFDFGFSDPTKVELNLGGKTAAYQKSGDKWMAGQKQMDQLPSGADRQAERFESISSGQGFTRRHRDAVTSNDGKRVEKVSIRNLATIATPDV